MKPEDLTTHALGENLPATDRESLEQTLQNDPQALAEFEATRDFTQFLQKHLGGDQAEAALTPEQQQRLLQQTAPAGKTHKAVWLSRVALPLSAAALVVLGFQQLREEQEAPAASKPPAKKLALQDNEPLAEVGDRERKERSDVTGSDTAALAEIRAPQATAAQSTPADKDRERQNAPRAAGLVIDDARTGNRRLVEDNQASAGLAAAPDKAEEAAKDGAAVAGRKLVEDEIAVGRVRAQPLDSPAAPAEPSTSVTLGASMASGPEAAATAAEPLSRPKVALTAEKSDEYKLALQVEVKTKNEALLAPSTPNEPTVQYYYRGAVIEQKVAPAPQPIPTAAPANESYTPIQENAITSVLREPLSTFSIDVDTASYANVRRFLNRSTLPPRDAVRIEELVNYFPYNYEGPAADSPHPFAVHVEVAGCPWQPQHRLVRIGIQGKKAGLEQRNSNFVFLIDVSGSMNQPDKLPLVKESLRLLVEQLGEQDRVSIVTYAGSSGLVLPPTGGEQKDHILAAIDNLSPGGSTHGSAGIQLAYEQAIAGFIPEGVNRVILCTDGDFNVGISTPDELEKLITEKARSGVFLSVLGFGTGNLKDRTMETLADKGNGNYGYIDSLSEARKLLVQQRSGTLVTIAKDVKIQVEFNPAQVSGYRLIGYENRLLAKEDFNDDTKDAGEIGAGHSVTALYEVVPAGLTPALAEVDALKYQPAPAAPAPAVRAEAASNELLTVKLRHKAPEGATSQLIEVPVTDSETTLAAASPEFKFTSAVAGYGLMLRQSSYRGALTWDQIRQLALEGKGRDPHGYRAEFLQLLDKARGLLPDNR